MEYEYFWKLSTNHHGHVLTFYTLGVQCVIRNRKRVAFSQKAFKLSFRLRNVGYLLFDFL